jgi:hypothetical protein
MDSLKITLAILVAFLSLKATRAEQAELPLLSIEELRAENEMVRLLNGIVITYADQNGGNLPKDLIPLRDYFDLPKQFSQNQRLGPFEKRYAILPYPINFEDVKLVVIGLNPVRLEPQPGHTTTVRFAGYYRPEPATGTGRTLIDESKIPAILAQLNGQPLNPIGFLPPPIKLMPTRDNNAYLDRLLSEAAEKKAANKIAQSTQSLKIPPSPPSPPIPPQISSSTIWLWAIPTAFLGLLVGLWGWKRRANFSKK